MKDRLILLFLLGAFIFLGIETRYLHQSIASIEPVAWIPVATAALGGLFCLMGMLGSKKMNQVLGILFILLSCSGLAGFYFHHKDDFDKGNYLTAERVLKSTLRDDRAQRAMDGGDPADPPPDLAPLGYTGLCLIAAVTLMVTRKETRVS